jgi:hypothetical protein
MPDRFFAVQRQSGARFLMQEVNNDHRTDYPIVTDVIGSGTADSHDSTVSAQSEHADPLQQFQYFRLKKHSGDASPADDLSTKPSLDDAFRQLDENVRNVTEDFKTLYAMLAPHLPKFLFSGDKAAACYPQAATADDAARASTCLQFSPTYGKVLDAAEAIGNMRHGLQMIIKHTIV